MSALDPKRDRTALVTGAGTGIGRSIAVKLGALGWRVAIGGRRAEPLAETAALVEQAGGTCFAHPLDVTDAASVERFFTRTEAELGKVTAAINNAGVGQCGLLEEHAPADIATEIATKLTGSLYVARLAIQSMRAGGKGGDILFMTSTSAVQPWPFHLAYAAANAGVEHAARMLRLELEGSGIRVNVLRCGETAGTEFAMKDMGTEQMSRAHDVWFRRGLLRHGGLMTPDIVADAVVTALTLPMSYQLELAALVPVAPIGELPRTYDDLIVSIMQNLAATMR
jgi:NAD(P)-dependent dehydrogenase (short-subunit alcohol dehydrogenase family)